jgi:predicted lipoprotein with Yx(FWY)xxD motif
MPNRRTRDVARRRRRSTAMAASTVAAVVLALAGLAVARSFTLQVKKNATVKSVSSHTTKHEPIITNSRGFAAYTLSGDSKSHPKCTQANSCLSVWPPVTAASAKALTKAPGISGKLTAWTHGGITQAVLNGHPLYTFVGDTKKGVASGEGIASFGGTWHVAVPRGVQGTQGLPQSY